MNFPVSNIVTSGNVAPAGSIMAAQQQQNALLASMYANQIARAQAQNAPANQLALTQQNQGAAQTALAGGNYAMSTAQANSLNAQLQPTATQAQINLANAETKNVGNTANQIPANSAANRALTLAQTWRTQNPLGTIAQLQSFLQNKMGALYNAINSNVIQAVYDQTSPSGSSPAAAKISATGGNGSATNTLGAPGTIGNINYSASRQRNGRTEYKVNGVWGYPAQ